MKNNNLKKKIHEKSHASVKELRLLRLLIERYWAETSVLCKTRKRKGKACNQLISFSCLTRTTLIIRIPEEVQHSLFCQVPDSFFLPVLCQQRGFHLQSSSYSAQMTQRLHNSEMGNMWSFRCCQTATPSILHHWLCWLEPM